MISEVVVNPSPTEKVDIARILMQRLDGVASNARVTTIEAANTVLKNWAEDVAPEDNARCAFQIEFEDGGRYHSHFAFGKPNKRISLAQYIRRQLAALASPKKSGRANDVNDAPVISLPGTSVAESAKVALEHYNI